MENKWIATCKALKELLQILTCSKCDKSLYDSQQFLMCGHITCMSCLNKNSPICIQCKDPLKNESIMKADLLENIVKACNTFSREFSLMKNDENIERKTRELQLIHKTEGGTMLDNADSTLILNNSNVKSNQNQGSQKIRKRKNFHWNRNKTSKKQKFKACFINYIPKSINKKNYIGETRLQKACKKGHQENVQSLLEAGADPNVSCNANWTPLQESVDYGYYEITKMLLNAGASVNQPGYEGRTPLHEAVKNSNRNLITLLLEYKADISITDKKGNKPVDYSQSNEITELLGYNQENKKQCITTEDNPNIITNQSTAKDSDAEEPNIKIIQQHNSEESGYWLDSDKSNDFDFNSTSIETNKEFNIDGCDLEEILHKNKLKETYSKPKTCITINTDAKSKNNLLNFHDNNLQEIINSVKEKENSNEISSSQETIDVECNYNSKNIIYISEKFQDVTSIIDDYKSNIITTSFHTNSCINLDSEENMESCICIDSEEIIDVLN